MAARGTLVAVVEDDPSMRQAIERLLCAAGLACVTYDSAEAFIARPVEAALDFAVIDVYLRAVGGLELQARLKAEVPALPVIMMTARDSEPVRRAALAQGCVAFLVKPFDGRTLIDAIRGTKTPH